MIFHLKSAASSKVPVSADRIDESIADQNAVPCSKRQNVE